jgi:D-Tyr-tRNAtyr deacylase
VPVARNAHARPISMPKMPDAREDRGLEATARWAFQLSYFLLADRRDARDVLYQVAARLYVTALAQKRRQAKRPRGEVHKKLNLTPRPLLQYLVYLCAEPYEQTQEQEYLSGARSLSVEDMIVRYIKHLMLLYLEHNSFYATVGQSCVLFDFGTGQAVRLYEVLVQGSPAHLETKGDYSVRDAKREMRRQLASRFGRLVTTCDGARKEQQFVAMNDAGKYFRLVKRCLHRLQPAQEANEQAGDWHLPARFDPTAYDLAQLQYDEKNRDPLAEPSAELRRMHAVIHPCCWARLLRASRLNYSRRRIVLPEFMLKSDEKTGRRPPYERHHQPELTAAELEGLTKMLRSESRRRKGLFASRLSLTVDGTERGSWTVDRDNQVTISVERGARVLEISARDEEGELLLAQHLLQLRGASLKHETEPTSVILEGGQEFTFNVSPDLSENGAKVVVTIDFRETKLHRAAARHLAHGSARLAGMLSGFYPPYAKPKVLIVSVCALLLAVLATGWWVLRTSQRNQPLPSVAMKETEHPLPSPAADTRDGAPPDKEAQAPPEQRVAVDAGTGAATGNNVRRPQSSGIALSLQDGERTVSLNARGKSTGLEGLPPKWRSAVEAALLARRVSKPSTLADLNAGTEMLLGSSPEGKGVSIISPFASVVESNRPVFRWRGSNDATGYIVTVFDSRYNRVAQSELLTAVEWTPGLSLGRGATYVWKVTTLRNGEAIVSPTPPAPEARFRVLEQSKADELARARALYPNSHLMLGVLYAQAGMTAEAEREFKALVESNPNSTVARSLLLSVQEWRKSR